MDKSNNTTITDGNEECKACGELQGSIPKYRVGKTMERVVALLLTA